MLPLHERKYGEPSVGLTFPESSQVLIKKKKNIWFDLVFNIYIALIKLNVHVDLGTPSGGV